MTTRLFSQQDIYNIWDFLSRMSQAKVARLYQVSVFTIRRIIDGTSYKLETRLVSPDVIQSALCALAERRKKRLYQTFHISIV